ncbi:MAG: acyl-CoA dehydrogenase family protein, partial [Oceanidesulfovibrio sp.]
EEPMLAVEKRGRFITNMAFANFVTAAVNTDDERIKSSCMVILEEGDEGIFDPGAPTLKMVHQLSATNDPVFSLKVPASRIIGGYTVQDGVIVPNYSHGEIIAAVFQRTRIPVGVMTAAKLLSAVEPVIRYQRGRFRGGESKPGTPRYELGLQQNEDANHRLLDVWSTGESMASLGFAAGRMADEFDPIEKEKDRLFIEREIKGPRAQLKALKPKEQEAIEMVQLRAKPEGERDQTRLDALEADPLVQYSYLSAMSNVYIPACKLWNTGYGCQMMREAVAMMGGYGITEDCPGFLGHKWMDAQLEATYEGPEVVQRRQLAISMTGPVFSAQLTAWVDELKRRAQETPGRGHCTLAAAFELWAWTVNHLQSAKDPEGKPLMHGRRQGVTFQLADALSWLVAVKCFMDDIDELAANGPQNAVVAEGLDELVDFYGDMVTWQAARAAGEAGRVAADLVFGYILHPDCAGECCGPEATGNLFDGAEEFYALRRKVDAAVAGARLAKDRAAADLTKVMIPEALDYPL